MHVRRYLRLNSYVVNGTVHIAIECNGFRGINKMQDLDNSGHV